MSVSWTRLVNGQWNLHAEEGDDTKGITTSIETLSAAHIIGIYHELKKLNALLHCSNFTMLPHRVARIESMMAKKLKRKKSVPRRYTTRSGGRK